MKRFYMLLLMSFFLGLAFQLKANPIAGTYTYWEINIPGLDVPPLIISEFRGDQNQRYYIELTNVGDEVINLSDFSLISGHTYTKMEGSTDSLVRLGHLFNYVPLEGILQPGESYVEISTWDVNFMSSGLPRHHIGLLDVADRIYHQPEPTTDSLDFLNVPEWHTFGFDSVSEFYPIITMPGTSCYYLEYKFINSEGQRDSTLIDNVNFKIDPDHNHGAWGKGNYNFPVAGISDPVRNNILVRKASITQGNMDWDLSRGTDAETSEWLVIPKFTDQFDYYTTVGVHGDFSLDFTVKDPGSVIYDQANKTLTLPWNVEKGQIVNRLFDFGPGMAWEYTENATDSLYTNVRNGDVFTLYATGNQLEILDLTINVQEPGPDVANVYAHRVYSSHIDNITGAEYWSWSNRYRVTQNLEVDSIYNIGYDTPVDTLLKYVYKPEKAHWEIEFVGGETRANLKRGDKLIVTSEDGTTTKEYLIQLGEFNPSNNANLAMISWPDYDPNIYWQWQSDTIPGFRPSRSSYTLRLMEGTTAIPALQFKPQNPNATVKVNRATSIQGSISQRTTTATVTSENGEIERTYSVTFEIQGTPIQPNFAEPFISELMLGNSFAYAIEIFNPGNQSLDLDRYMIAAGNADANLDEIVSTFNYNNHIYRYHYVPGYRFRHDTDMEAWAVEPGFLVPDNVTSTVVEPGEVFTAGTRADGAWPGGRFEDRQIPGFTDWDLDFFWYGLSEQVPGSSVGGEENIEFRVNNWGLNINRYAIPITLGFTRWGTTESLFLLKILNDSILDGTKDITDPFDYEIVDRIQKPLDSDNRYISGRDMTDPHWQGWNLTRKPHVWRGVTERGAGLGDNGGQSEENSEWIVFNHRNSHERPTGTRIWDNIGSHEMDPITVYLSTITSTKLLVTPGYEGDLTITGDLTGLTAELFMSLLDKADPGQVLEVFDGADIIAPNDPIAADMTLKVTSFDGQNTSTYTLVNSPLSSDNMLVAKDDSGLTVSLMGPQGSVDGVTVGTSLKSLLEMLEVPDKAVLNVINADNNLVPLTAMNYDSLKVDVIATPAISFEVVAENGDIALYSLGFGFDSSDAVLLSDFLDVDQDLRLVSSLPTGIAPQSLLALVFVNEGATMRLVDKFGVERGTTGRVNYDDEIIVTSPDGTVSNSYKLKFAGVALVGNIMATVTFKVYDLEGEYPDGFMLKGSWNTETGVFDPGWNDGAEHTPLYDDGTHGDDVAGDNIWTVTLPLAVDKGENTWEWGFNDMAGNFIPESNIQFTLEDAAGIETSYSVAVNVSDILGTKFRVYPVPASNELKIEGINLQEARFVQIFDIIGQEHIVRMEGSDRINVSGLNQGIYILRITKSDGTVSSVKFIKK